MSDGQRTVQVVPSSGLHPSYLNMDYDGTYGTIIHGFSWGSSSDPVGPSNNFCSPSSPAQDATGMPSPVPNSLYYSEDLGSAVPHTHKSRSPPSAQNLSTLAEMAIIMSADSQQQPVVSQYDDLDHDDDQPLDGTAARERKHACTMCHKRFDRPSTLKKHLLVHTGEKAFQCETCGRRFGVASNLNRHVKRCILKPVNGGPGAAAAVEQQTPEPVDQDTMPIRTKPRPAAATAQKRRRRTVMPNVWIPGSLVGFNLLPPQDHEPTPVPLPPVCPSIFEERDSWDENVGDAPYHPREWVHKPRLPGPGTATLVGLLGKDVRNINFRGNGGYMARLAFGAQTQMVTPMVWT